AGSNEAGAGEFWWVDEQGNKIRRVIAGDPLPEDQVNVEATLDSKTGQSLARTDPRRVLKPDDATVTPLQFKQDDPLANSGVGVRAATDAAAWASKTPSLPAGFQTGEQLHVRVPAGLNDADTYAALSDATLEALGAQAKQAGDRYRAETGHNLAQPSVSFAELVQN